MAIVYTKHATDMLTLRNITKDLVEKCIKKPDEILSAREGKTIYLKDFGKNFLKLIVYEEGENMVVITLYWLAKKRVKQ